MATALFLLDMLLNSLMLLLALRLAGYRVRPLRIVLGAFAGSAAAALARHTAMPVSALLWLPAAIGMMAAAGGRQAVRRPLRSALALLCACALAGGIVLFFLNVTGSLAVSYAACSLCAVCIACAASGERKTGLGMRRVRLLCRYRDREAEFDAMIDSGNCLRDYLTRLPVIVLPQESAYARLGLEDAPLRPIFADTAGGRQMMFCFLPQETALVQGRMRRRVQAVLALSPGLSAEHPALVPASLVCGES